MTPIKGTGDGGMTPGRKIKAFLWLVVSVGLFTALTTKMGTPEQIAIQGLYMIGAGGMFVIGGQSLVDAFGQWATTKTGQREIVETASTTTSKKVK